MYSNDDPYDFRSLVSEGGTKVTLNSFIVNFTVTKLPEWLRDLTTITVLDLT